MDDFTWVHEKSHFRNLQNFNMDFHNCRCGGLDGVPLLFYYPHLRKGKQNNELPFTKISKHFINRAIAVPNLGSAYNYFGQRWVFDSHSEWYSHTIFSWKHIWNAWFLFYNLSSPRGIYMFHRRTYYIHTWRWIGLPPFSEKLVPVGMIPDLHVTCT